MEFHNENFERIYKHLLDNPELVDKVFITHPKAKVAAAAVVILAGGDYNPDDWECDMGNIVFREARAVNKKTTKFLNELDEEEKKL